MACSVDLVAGKWQVVGIPQKNLYGPETGRTTVGTQQRCRGLMHGAYRQPAEVKDAPLPVYSYRKRHSGLGRFSVDPGGCHAQDCLELAPGVWEPGASGEAQSKRTSQLVHMAKRSDAVQASF